MKRFVAPLLLMVLSSFTSSQTAAPKNTTAEKAESVQRGVVVEEVTKNSAAEKAGLQEGDVLLNWKRGDAAGNIESPFDVSGIAIEQGHRGAVSLQGVRGSEESHWILQPGPWGLKTRPHLPPSLLLSYLEGQKLAQSGKSSEAAELWRTAANHLDGSAPSSVLLWLLSRSADAFLQGRQWQKADEAYQQALQQVGETLPAARALLLRAWANRYKQQGDWLNAEKYDQQSIAENQKSGPENLIIASTLDDLGTILRSRDLLKSAEYYRQALEIRQKLAPRSLAVADSLIRLADVVRQQEDLTKAEEYARQALEIAEELAPGGLAVAGSVNILGIVAVLRGELGKAEEYFRQALEIRQKWAPGSMSAAGPLTNLGYVAWQRGELEKAEEYYLQAFEISKQSPRSLGMADGLNDLGSIAEQRGELAKAEEYNRQALEIRQELAPEGLRVADSLNNLGNLAKQRGEFAKAEGYHRQTLEIRQKQAPGRLAVANSLNNLGNVAEQRGELAKAEGYYRQALEIRQKRAPGGLAVADSLNNLGSVAEQREELAKAEEYYRQALEIRQKSASGSLAVAASLDNLGNVAMRRGELAKAEEYCHQGLDIRQKQAPGGLVVADSLSSLGDVAEQQGDIAKAKEYYRQALDLRHEFVPHSGYYADSLAVLAKILRREEHMGQALELYQQALDVLEKQMAMFGGSEETRSGFRSNHLGFYRAFIDLLVQEKQPERAFQVLERSRAQGLLETLVAAGVDIRKGVDLKLVEKERSLRELLTGKSNRLIKLLKDNIRKTQAADLDKEIQEIRKQYQDVEGEIRQISPVYSALTQPRPLSVGEVQQQLLDSDTLLLEYTLGEERSYVFAVTQDSITAFPLPKRADIEAPARELYHLLSDYSVRDDTRTQRQSKVPAEYAKALATLSRMVLGPVAGQLNKKRLLIVSDGALQYVPFAILSDPEDPAVPLMAKHEVVNLPSATALAVLRQQLSGRKAAPKAVAVLADPVFDVHDDRLRLATKNDKPGPPDSSQVSERSELERSAREAGLARGGVFPRLPFSRREADAIYSIARQGEATKALDFDASKATAMDSRLRDYRIVHFATHGLLNSEHPELSGLVFSLVDRQGKTQDGFLRLLDIYNLDLNADLVVLSACQTALGKQIAEEGLVGLTRGFMYAGAPRVMASLWKVDDEATAELMKKFYEGVLKNQQTPAQALRSAQMWMSQQKQWAMPYYWAGFVLQGEWK